MRLNFDSHTLIVMSAIISGFLGLLFYNNKLVMYSLIAIECLVLLVILLKGKHDVYLCLLLIFTTMSQEFDYFLGPIGTEAAVMYSFKETRFLGINLSLFFTILFLVKILLMKNLHVNNVICKNCTSFIKWIFAIAIIEIIVGSINILIDDNDISNIPNVWFIFAQVSSYVVFIAIMAYCTVVVLKVYGKEKIEETLKVTMICNMIIPVFSSMMGVEGSYGGKSLYLTLSSYILCIFIIILPAYDEYKNKIFLYMIIAAVGVFYPLFFKSIAFGKMLLLLAFAMILFFYLRSKGNTMWLFISAMVFFIIFASWSFLVEYLVKNNPLFSYKYKQVLSLISIWYEGWYDNLLPSPKVRITEFCNILIEYANKPWFFITGKGILGSVKDYMHGIKMFNLSIYSYDEFMIQSYYRVHETINSFFLQSGIVGLLFLIKYLKIVFSNIRNNPWIVVGGIWLLVFWGYSTTRSTFGIVCFCLGLYIAGENEVKLLAHDKINKK